MSDAKTDFCWLIEAPGSRYLAVREIGHSYDFHWTDDPHSALRFQTKNRADATMMAIRAMNEKICGGPYLGLFGFEATLGNAKAVEHGWIGARP